MKKSQIVVSILMLLIVVSTAFASCPELQQDCLNEFYKNPNADNFKLIENPTAEQFSRLSSPTLENFNHLDQSQQQQWISSYADFNQQNHLDLAQNFFSQSPSNANNNGEKFKEFVKAYTKGLEIVSFDGTLKEFNKEGLLRGNSASININDFKGKLAERFGLIVKGGELVLIQKETQKEIPFTGDLQKQPNNKFSLKEGSFSGHSIKEAEEIIISKDGTIQGKVKEYDGLVFKGSTLIKAVPSSNGYSIVTLNGGQIESVSTTAKIYLKGKALINKAYDQIKGSIIVPKGSSLELNEVKISSQTEEVHLEFQQQNPILDETKKAIVSFSKKIEGIGNGFEIIFSAENLRNYETKATGEYKGYLNLPNKGYYSVGDSSEDIKLIQREVGLTETGVYDEATKQAVKEWQEKVFTVTGICSGMIQGKQCVGDGLFGKKSVNNYLKTKGEKITLSPKDGKVNVENGDTKVNIRTKGSATVELGTVKLKSTTSSLYKTGIRLVRELGDKASTQPKTTPQDKPTAIKEDIVNYDIVDPSEPQTLDDALGLSFTPHYSSDQEELHQQNVEEEKRLEELNRVAVRKGKIVSPQEVTPPSTERKALEQNKYVLQLTEEELNQLAEQQALQEGNKQYLEDQAIQQKLTSFKEELRQIAQQLQQPVIPDNNGPQLTDQELEQMLQQQREQQALQQGTSEYESAEQPAATANQDVPTDTSEQTYSGSLEITPQSTERKALQQNDYTPQLTEEELNQLAEQQALQEGNKQYLEDQAIQQKLTSFREELRQIAQQLQQPVIPDNNEPQLTDQELEQMLQQQREEQALQQGVSEYQYTEQPVTTKPQTVQEETPEQIFPESLEITPQSTERKALQQNDYTPQLTEEELNQLAEQQALQKGNTQYLEDQALQQELERKTSQLGTSEYQYEEQPIQQQEDIPGVPITITLEDQNGKDAFTLEQNGPKPEKPIKKVKIGNLEYELHVGEAYVVAAGQTAFTKAVAPPLDAKELSNLPPQLRDQVSKAGHMAVLYVDNGGNLRVSESDWDGVSDKPFVQSHLNEVKNTISGIYEFRNADSSKIIVGAQSDAKQNIGWFFMPLDQGIGTSVANSAMNKEYTSYRSCASHVCTLASYGGVDLTKDLPSLPMQDVSDAALQAYLKSYGITSPIAVAAMKTAIRSFAGSGQAFATPSQIILAGIEQGKISALTPKKASPIQVAKK